MTTKSILSRISGFFFASLFLVGVLRAQDIGELSGSLQLNVGDGSNTPGSPAYVIAGASLSQEAVYTGAIASVSGNNVTFAGQENIEGTTADPFIADVLASGVVRATAVLSGDGVASITVVSGGSSLSAAPTVTIDDPDTGTSAADFTADVAGGVVTGFTQASAGAGYSSAPTVTVDSGRHFLRITSGDAEGRSFLIDSNTATTVAIDTDYLANGEANAAALLSANDTVEIVRASTLGDLFGTTDAEVSATFGSASRSNTSDWVYLWDDSIGFYISYFFSDGSGRGSEGWYRTNDRRMRRMKNETLINPDEAFIIACRNTTPATPKFNGTVVLEDPQLKLPAAGGHHLMTNPYGADILLTELLPNDAIGTGSTKFYPANNDEDGDLVYVLQTGGSWEKYYHKTTNVGITEVATCTAVRLSGGAVSSAYLAYPADPSNLNAAHKCTIQAMSNPTADSDTPANGWILITTPAAHGLLTGDIVTIAGAKGYKTQDGDPSIYLDSSGNEVLTTGEALQIDTSANGTWSITKVGASTFKIPKSGNAEYIGNSGYWATGTGGAGYSQNAKVYFIGNGASNGYGTATVAGGKVTDITGVSGGSGYGTTPPQAIFSSGSWRDATDPNQDVGNKVIDGGAGILLTRHSSNSGVLTYLKSYNPAK